MLIAFQEPFSGSRKWRKDPGNEVDSRLALDHGDDDATNQNNLSKRS